MAIYTALYVHCVWATWNWLPLITPAAEPLLYATIDSKCRALACDVLAIGGIDDHIHLLVRFPATLSIARLVEQVKGSSAYVMNHQVALDTYFKWQGGYGAFTFSKRSVRQLQNYVRSQKQHHADQTLIDALERVSAP